MKLMNIKVNKLIISYLNFLEISNSFDLELENTFRALNFTPNEFWNDSNLKITKYPGRNYIDKAQYKDPFFLMNTEVEQPKILRDQLRKWRSGSEIRFKMPYYPEEKTPFKSFNYH